MQCPSCGVISESEELCTECDVDVISTHDMDADLSLELEESGQNAVAPQETRPKSTLIEFPGVSRRPVPEWRKELSERVREVQERRAREAATEMAETEATRAMAEASAPPQLELLPATEPPVINPLVAAALKRIERAHQGTPVDSRRARRSVAAAVAYAPAREENEALQPSLITGEAQLSFSPEFAVEVTETVELPRERPVNLVVVPDPEPAVAKVEPTPPPTPPLTPKRLISDEDPALNYLDSITRDVCIDELAHNRAGAFRRLTTAILDIVICALLTSPIAGAAWYFGNNLRDPKSLIILGSCLVVIAFFYFTVTTALTGRTWAMRLSSLRIIDVKTGLIPTGGQSVSRSILYLFSLATAGLGILFSLISREGYTFHDRITRTAVIKI